MRGHHSGCSTETAVTPRHMTQPHTNKHFATHSRFWHGICSKADLKKGELMEELMLLLFWLLVVFFGFVLFVAIIIGAVITLIIRGIGQDRRESNLIIRRIERSRKERKDFDQDRRKD